MIPTVAQQVGAVRTTIAKTLLPALDPNDAFAAEQGALALACLDWVLDVQASEVFYEVAEHSDYRRALIRLQDLAPAEAGESARKLVDTTGVVPDNLDDLREQVRSLKDSVSQMLAVCTESGADLAEAAQCIVTGVATRQTARELSWCRMTGFPEGQPPNIGEILAKQK